MPISLVLSVFHKSINKYKNKRNNNSVTCALKIWYIQLSCLVPGGRVKFQKMGGSYFFRRILHFLKSAKFVKNMTHPHFLNFYLTSQNQAGTFIYQFFSAQFTELFPPLNLWWVLVFISTRRSFLLFLSSCASCSCCFRLLRLLLLRLLLLLLENPCISATHTDPALSAPNPAGKKIRHPSSAPECLKILAFQPPMLTPP